MYMCCVFFNDTASTEIYTYVHTLSLHDALPISYPLATSLLTTSAASAKALPGRETAGREPPGGPVGAILSDPARAFDLRDALKRVEHDLLQQALAAQRYNQRATARQRGLTYDQLRGRLRKHQLLENGRANVCTQ